MKLSRRSFLRGAASSAIVAPYVTSGLRAQSANGKVRHVSFGSSGQAGADIDAFSRHPAFELVAVADVDARNLQAIKAKFKDRFPDLRVYQDWRELIAKEADKIDSVNVSTPDHMHVPIGAACMAKGKHVYGQKPLAQNLFECRLATTRAREKGLITQMGIQVSSDFTERFAVEAIHSGAIGKVIEVHSFSDKKWGDMAPVPDKTDTPPADFNWDLWLGTAAERPFINGFYHPGNWRKRRDFGTGTLGDMGCHIFSSWYRGVGLTSPISIKSTGPKPPNASNWAINGQVEFTFPGTQYTEGKTVKVTWYDGDARPPANIAELVGGKVPGQGNIVIGTEGVLLHPHMSTPTVFPKDKSKTYKHPKLEPRDHYREFLDCVIDGKKKPSANFDYAGPLTESVLLGCLASIYPGQVLEWDAANLKVTNCPDAAQYIKRQYRKGWEIA